MKFNATYQYRNASTENLYVDGGSCYIEETISEQLRDAEWGKEIVYGYKMYVKEKSRFNLSLGDIVDITMQDGQQFVCTVIGVDFTVRKIYTFHISSTTGVVSSNGSVEFKTKSGGGIDSETGYPIATTVAWSKAIGCRFMKSTENLLAKSNNEPYSDVNYIIYIEQKVLPSEQLRLSDESGSIVGEFSIISSEYIDTKGITKIIV